MSKTLLVAPWSRRRLTDVNGTLFFVSGDELWKSDGTESGTEKVKEIPGIGGTDGRIPEFAAIGDTFFFPVADNEYGGELWVSDGTPDGTHILKDILPGDDGADPDNLTVFNGQLYFAASDGDSRQIWKTDGTEAGTQPASDLVYGPSQLFVSNDTLYFFAWENGNKLWESDGTPEGTNSIVGGFSIPLEISEPDSNGVVYFKATGALWRTDGTAAGTIRIKEDIGNPYSPSYLTLLNDTLLFAGQDENGTELWKSDGTTAGTELLKDIEPGASSSSLRELARAGNTVFFSASGGFWKTDGTLVGTSLVRPIQGYIDRPHILDETIFLSVSHNGVMEIWTSDGTESGTGPVTDLGSTNDSSRPHELTEYDGKVFFSANDGVHGEELWYTDGTTAGTQLLDIAAGSAWSRPSHLTVVNDELFFSANSSPATSQSSLWKTDGTPAGTVEVADAWPGRLTAIGDELFFQNFADDTLWKSDGTEAGTKQVSSVPRDLAYITDVGGIAYFQAHDSDHGRELWRSDGTEAGTFRLTDIQPGTQDSSPLLLNGFNGSLYFLAVGDGNYDLWKSDGTVAGTTRITTGLNVSSGLTVANDIAFFTVGWDEERALWKYDGQNAPSPVRETDDAELPLMPEQMTAVDDRLFFVGDDGVSGRELWISDGTGAGTRRVVDLFPGANSSQPRSLTNVDGTLYFTASDGKSGHEVWRTDGTAAGTILVHDILGEARPDRFTPLDDQVIFTAVSNDHGTELWTLETPPTGRVRSLPATTMTDQIDIAVDLLDAEEGTWDLYVAVDNGGWTLHETGLPVTQTSVSVSLESHRRYWFRAVVTDADGVQEDDPGVPEANTLTGDVSAPDSEVNSAVADVAGLVTVNMSGSDAGESGLQEFEVLVAIDGGELMPAAPSAIPAGNPVDGIYSALVEYQALRDSTLHTYDFFVIGIDGAGNREDIPETADATISVMADPADPLEATAIDIQQQTTQRSFVQFADIAFNDTNGLMDLIDNGRVAVERFALDDATPAIGTGLPVTGFSASVAGNSIRLDFGSTGLGGAGHLGNGFYRILLDMDGDGVLGDAHFEFFRLYGDANGDGKVDRNDRRVTEDLTGDGIVTSADRRLFRSEGRRGDSLLDELFALLDD